MSCILTDVHYQIYTESFPDFPVDSKAFFRMLGEESREALTEEADGKTVGYSIVSGDSIALMCVLPEYQGQGRGSRLLAASEGRIRAMGFGKARIGRGENIITQGVPVPGKAPLPFFEKRGYIGEWYTVNMILDLADFDIGKLKIPPAPLNVTFRLCDSDSLPSLYDAVSDAMPEWLCAFEEEGATALICEYNGEIVGFELLSADGGMFSRDGELATIGCVGVTHKARNAGIGRQLVAEGCKRLRERGSARVQVRYVTLAEWYAALGFKVSDWHWMAEKTL